MTVMYKYVDFYTPPPAKFAGIYSDPYVRPFVRPSVRSHL